MSTLHQSASQLAQLLAGRWTLAVLGQLLPMQGGLGARARPDGCCNAARMAISTKRGS